ncbi:MAG: endonuclease III domain-containing protein [Candidatus Thermoplasmatota archaeon]|nr:endonuclease III domain-containing protein [Candidatus Thermoplasmatota archaeon]
MPLTPHKLYTHLLAEFSPQHWWPVDHQYHQQHHSDPRVEIIIGALLTQNTAWTNVEKALDNLKKHHALTINALLNTNETTLKNLIQPSGFFNQKAVRLRALITYLHDHYHDDLTRFFSRDTDTIRHELLSLNGIGPETADSILLYAGDHPVFVVDAYTKRIAKRLPLNTNGTTYEQIQVYFQSHLKKTVPSSDLVAVYKELHALLVVLAKHHCQKKPHCTDCPLTRLCQKLL